VHAFDDSYLKRTSEIKKCELELDEDDYIEYIRCAYSSQKTFIRSIRLATKDKKLIVHEGEIELKYQNQDELIHSKDFTEDFEEGTLRKSKKMSKSAVCTPPKQETGENKMKLLCANNLKSQSPLDTVSNPNSEHESSFEVKHPSLVDFYLKNQSCNLRKLGLKIRGFKTYFNGYIEDIEIYAEAVERHESENSDPKVTKTIRKQ